MCRFDNGFLLLMSFVLMLLDLTDELLLRTLLVSMSSTLLVSLSTHVCLYALPSLSLSRISLSKFLSSETNFGSSQSIAPGL